MRLLCQSFHEFWVTMALVDGGVSGEEVEVVLSFLDEVRYKADVLVAASLTGSQTEQPLALAKTIGSG